MLRVLVTGGTGLVGNALRAIAAEYPTIELVFISSKDGDLTDYNATYVVIQRHMPLDGIIHLAANVGGLFKNMNNPVDMTQDNLWMNTNVLAVAHQLNINNVISCLSTCIFPDVVESYPITAASLHNGPPHHSNEGYAYAKRMTEVLSRAYQRQFNRRYFCVVPTNVYGPHDNFHLADAHVAPALIHKCYLAQKENRPFIIAGDGTPLRQFIFSEDLARGIMWAYEHYASVEYPLLLVPPNSEVPIAKLVSTIVEAFSFKGAVCYDATKPNGQHKKTANNSTLDIKWTSLEEGIARTVAWFVERKKTLDEGTPDAPMPLLRV